MIAVIGSPPHTWGIPGYRHVRHRPTRITPTYMGNTCRKSWYTYLVRDHPHIHGEYGFIQQHFAIVEGSPPHTWGIPKESLTNAGMDRITPTYMGNTDQTDRRKSSTGDHPHIHGEYVAVPNGALAASGSPPHTWGIPVAEVQNKANEGITPTYMGNTQPKLS